ncbi:hypothetical protein [Streptomyces sp. NPDC053367]|uniref:hypothetical protein n=1 Tax=Streptomyces sp. NPDC053367 TaxID=3365700 RepID=UPI0037D0E2CF
MPMHRSMRDLLGPVAAVALIAQLNPDLPAPDIEFADIYRDDMACGAGLRLHMHRPEPGVYERWAHLIGSDDPDSHTDPRPSRRGTVCRRTYGNYAQVPIEAIAYLPAAQHTRSVGAVA